MKNIKCKTFYSVKRGDIEKIVSSWLMNKQLEIVEIKYSTTLISEDNGKGEPEILESIVIFYS